MNKKIIIFGMGLMGNRFAEVLGKLYPDSELLAFRSAPDGEPNSLGLPELYSWQEVDAANADIAFITNPTNLHIDTSIECAKRGIKLFIEKPLDSTLDRFDELLEIVDEKKIATYVAYCLRFNPLIDMIKGYVEENKPLHYRVITTNHMPSWRPGGEPHRTYSASEASGGGVILDLSHEFDYTGYILGGVTSFSSNFSRQSNVTVDAEDFVDIIAESEKCPVNMHINFMGHIAQREIQIDFEDFSLVADLKALTISEYRDRELSRTVQAEGEYFDMYDAQVKYFMDNLENTRMMNNITEAAELLRFLLSIKSGPTLESCV